MTELRSHHVFSRFVRSVEAYLSKKGLNIALISIIIFHMWVFINATVHEAGHVFVARHFGCEAGLSQLLGYIASTGVNCPDDMPVQNWWYIAYAGPLVAFVFGSYLWFLEPDGYARLGGLVAFLFSTLPNIAFWIPGSDAYKAVNEFGYSWFNALIIYAVVGSYIAFLVMREIADKKWEIFKFK